LQTLEGAVPLQVAMLYGLDRPEYDTILGHLEYATYDEVLETGVERKIRELQKYQDLPDYYFGVGGVAEAFLCALGAAVVLFLSPDRLECMRLARRAPPSRRGDLPELVRACGGDRGKAEEALAVWWSQVSKGEDWTGGRSSAAEARASEGPRAMRALKRGSSAAEAGC
jgi:hypothetical protein